MKKTILCIGATLLDELYFANNTIIAACSNPAQKTTSIGGVISNIAQHLAFLEVNPALITAIGNDADGTYIQDSFRKSGIDSSHSKVVQENTGKYVSILQPDGNLYVAVCEDTCGKYITAEYLATQTDYILTFDILIIDTNLETNTIQWLIHFASIHNKKIIIEPVSVAKADKLARLDLNGVFMITPNEEELQALCANDTQQDQYLSSLFDRGVQTVWLRKGAKGSEIVTPSQTITLAVPTIQIVDSTGAGDAALAGWVFGYVNDQDSTTCLQLGHTLALETLKSKGAVNPSITPEILYQQKKNYYHD